MVVLFIFLAIIFTVFIVVIVDKKNKSGNSDNSDLSSDISAGVKKRKTDFYLFRDWIIGNWIVNTNNNATNINNIICINQISFIKKETYTDASGDGLMSTFRKIGESYQKDLFAQRLIVNTQTYAMNYIECNKIVKTCYKLMPRNDFIKNFSVNENGVAHTFMIYKGSKSIDEFEICLSEFTLESVKTRMDIRIRRVEKGFSEDVYLSAKREDDLNYETEFKLTKINL